MIAMATTAMRTTPPTHPETIAAMFKGACVAVAPGAVTPLGRIAVTLEAFASQFLWCMEKAERS